MNIAFVPLRSGSKSIPGKNIKNFCGKPLVFWNLEALEKCSSIDLVFVATDCAKIKELVLAFNFSKIKVYDRDPQNARDESTTESAMLEFINKQSFDDDDLFLLVQATSPFTQTRDFYEALETFKSQKADSLLTCVRSKRFFWDEKGKPMNYDHNKRPRRQEFKGVLLENGAFYISSVGSIKKTQNRLNGNIVIYEMPDYTSVEIDEDDDWNIAENLMKKHILEKNEN